MAKMDRSMSLASRLAAATALTGTLAACDGRLGDTTDGLFTPLATGSATEAALKSPPPAEPGNPIFIDGSRAANDALYQQTYGAPLAGSGQSLPVPQSFANSVYQDTTIAAAPILDIPGGPVIDAGALSSGALSSSPVYTPEAIAYSQPQPQPQSVAAFPVTTFPELPSVAPSFEAPVPQYSVPITTVPAETFPTTLQAEPVYTPQSNLLPTQVFTDASAVAGPRDIESLLDGIPEPSAPYGSSASHRYSVAEEPLPSLAALPEYTPLQYSIPLEMIEADPITTTFVQSEPIAPVESVEVAGLGNAYVPMPRARPARIGPVFETKKEVATLAPVPTARPAMLRTPLPKLRPVQLVAVSGRAITDAPPLTAPPMMIEVDPIFLDDPQFTSEAESAVPEVETAALAPIEVPDLPKSDASLETMFKPEEAETEVAAIQPTETIVEPRVEIASDVGDLKELSGTSWRLSSLEGAKVPASAELHFDGGSGFAGGQGICNNYGGEFSESLKGDFEMSNIFSTETECEHYALEKKYIVALETASNYRMAPGLRELMLVGPNGKTIATFEAF
jgi:heat shock protein HslJ